MEKYGVDEDPEKPATKTANEGLLTCPTCGQKLRPPQRTGVFLCPKCGSKPFEHSELANAPK